MITDWTQYCLFEFDLNPFGQTIDSLPTLGWTESALGPIAEMPPAIGTDIEL
jgi:muconolactone delta-isomerase